MYRPSVLAIIPARKSSNEVPGKNSRLLNDKPLICYTITSALEASLIDTIVISTNCPRILEISKQYEKIEVPFVRPEYLATDRAPSISVVQHTLDYYETIGRTFDYVCLLQPTVPFRSGQIIDRCIEEVVKQKADSLITVAAIPTRYNPLWAYRMDGGSLHPLVPESVKLTRRQDLPPFFCRNGSVYISTSGLIKEHMITGGKVAYLIDEHENHINIDSLADWKTAELIASTLYDNA